jgi:hypothetical protein
MPFKMCHVSTTKKFHVLSLSMVGLVSFNVYISLQQILSMNTGNISKGQLTHSTKTISFQRCHIKIFMFQQLKNSM